MASGILHLHLLLALIFAVALWRAAGVWLRMGGAVGVMLLATGIHNFLTRMDGAPPGWHALVGIKVLLGLHAITMMLLLARGRGEEAKRARWRKGALITAALTILIGLYFSNIARG